MCEYVCACAYVCICVSMCMRVCSHVCVHACTCMHMCAHLHVFMWGMCVHVRVYMCAHACACVHCACVFTRGACVCACVLSLVPRLALCGCWRVSATSPALRRQKCPPQGPPALWKRAPRTCRAHALCEKVWVCSWTSNPFVPRPPTGALLAQITEQERGPGPSRERGGCGL